MKTRSLYFRILLFVGLYVHAHAIENISVGQVTHTDKELHIQLSLLVEELKPVLVGLDGEVSFRNYMHKPFDDAILPAISNYMKLHLEVSVNNKLLKSEFKTVEWVVQHKYTDHAAIMVTMTYPCEKPQDIKHLKIKNTVLLQKVYGQTNILNVQILNRKTTLLFKRGKEVNEVVF